MKQTGEPGLISVMMPAYNAEPFIAAAIDSLLQQSYANWELIIVNDGSTDGTATVAARYDDPRIIVFTQANRGEAAARNAALEQMRGEFVAFLDADDLFLPHHLEVTAGYLQAHPEHDAVYTDGFHIDENGTRLKTLSSRRRGPFQGDIFEEVVLASDVFGPPTCVVLRRAPVMAAQLRFDEQIVIGPDWDFLTHAAERMTFGYIDTQSVLYRVHRTNVTRRVDATRRAGYLARCREKAIRLPRFADLPAATRVAVFYDLLVNLLPGQPERQAALVQGPPFRALPAAEQARLFRLMAREGLFATGERPASRQKAREWLEEARRLQPGNWRAAILTFLFRASPVVCQGFWALKRIAESQQRLTNPLVDPLADLY